MNSERLKNIELEASALVQSIVAEREAGVAYFDSVAAVSDPFATPFFRAVEREGFKPVVVARSGCVELKTCPRCRSHSTVLHVNGSRRVWLCPACDRH